MAIVVLNTYREFAFKFALVTKFSEQRVIFPMDSRQRFMAVNVIQGLEIKFLGGGHSAVCGERSLIHKLRIVIIYT
jgi:hypothetical protein